MLRSIPLNDLILIIDRCSDVLQRDAYWAYRCRRSAISPGTSCCQRCEKALLSEFAAPLASEALLSLPLFLESGAAVGEVLTVISRGMARRLDELQPLLCGAWSTHFACRPREVQAPQGDERAYRDSQGRRLARGQGTQAACAAQCARGRDRAVASGLEAFHRPLHAQRAGQVRVRRPMSARLPTEGVAAIATRLWRRRET